MTANIHETKTPQDLNQFQSEHSWLLIADGPTLSSFHDRWERSRALPGTFWGGGQNGLWKYYKNGLPEDTPDYSVSVSLGCTCPDAGHRAPMGWCKHRLAVWILESNLKRGIVETALRAQDGQLADLFTPKTQDRFPLREAA